MKQRCDIRSLSVELRTRLEEEVFNPLLSLEKFAFSKTYSAVVVEKVFKDFRQISDGIWEDLHKKSMINDQAKASGRDDAFPKKTQTRIK